MSVVDEMLPLILVLYMKVYTQSNPSPYLKNVYIYCLFGDTWRVEEGVGCKSRK